MGRLDGTFPPYQKLEIDSDVWPDDYWESSRRCPKCGQCWPANGLFHISPCCGESTILNADEVPHMRWPDAVKELLKFRFGQWYEEYNDAVDDERLPWTDITTNGQFDEVKAKAEVDALIDDVNNSSIRK
jgi:hypothetical protein